MEPLSARTPPELVRAGAEHHGEREAIVDGAGRLTHAGPAERVARFAGALAARGVGKGDRVALWAPNRKERLANDKLPRSYVFLDALPRNAGGKVLKTTLREDA